MILTFCAYASIAKQRNLIGTRQMVQSVNELLMIHDVSSAV